jgi:ABC-2 type transport system permease protein
VLGGGVSILAFLGGAWGPIGGDHGFMHVVSQGTPTYWLVQAGYALVGQKAWSSTGWLVVAVWAVVLAGLAARAYQRDTKRV